MNFGHGLGYSSVQNKIRILGYLSSAKILHHNNSNNNDNKSHVIIIIIIIVVAVAEVVVGVTVYFTSFLLFICFY